MLLLLLFSNFGFLCVCSDFIVSFVSMLKAFVCKIGAHTLPCVVHSVCCTWIFGRLGLSQFEEYSALLHDPLMDGLGHNGTLCTAICVRIFHVSSNHPMGDSIPFKTNADVAIALFRRFLVCLCCEKATYGCRSAMIPVHASIGLATFMLAIGTCIAGLTEKAIWALE